MNSSTTGLCESSDGETPPPTFESEYPTQASFLQKILQLTKLSYQFNLDGTFYWFGKEPEKETIRFLQRNL